MPSPLSVHYNRSQNSESDVNPNRMATLFSHEAFHDDVGHAFDELMLMDQLSRLPEASLARILQSFPTTIRQQALASVRPPEVEPSGGAGKAGG